MALTVKGLNRLSKKKKLIVSICDITYRFSLRLEVLCVSRELSDDL